MVFELSDTSKVESIYAGWEDTMIYSCLQRVMGRIYVTDIDAPQSALAVIGDFRFLAGVPEKELIMKAAGAAGLIVPRDESWAELIETCLPVAEKKLRYAIRKDTVFDRERLKRFSGSLPEGYELRRIDSALYDRCLENAFSADFVRVFETKEAFLKLGRGFVVLKGNEIVSGASSYTRYIEGIEIEVDTLVSERRKDLAIAACAALILSCLDEGLYPSWDAMTKISVRLAEKLGYEFDHEYAVYEIKQ